jgi:hypothetical protein
MSRGFFRVFSKNSGVPEAPARRRPPAVARFSVVGNVRRLGRYDPIGLNDHYLKQLLQNRRGRD